MPQRSRPNRSPRLLATGRERGQAQAPCSRSPRRPWPGCAPDFAREVAVRFDWASCRVFPPVGGVKPRAWTGPSAGSAGMARDGGSSREAGTMRWESTYPPDNDRAAAVRADVAYLLAWAGDRSLVADTTAVADELVANAIRHGRTDPCDGRGRRQAHADTSVRRGPRAPRDEGRGPRTTSGGGLVIVAAVATTRG